MRTLTLVSFLFFTVSLSAQSKLSIGASAQIRNFDYDKSILDANLIATGPGINLNYHFADRFFLEAELAYLSGLIDSKGESELCWGTQHDGLGGFDPDLPGEGTYLQYQQKSILAPIYFGYSVLNKEKIALSPILSAGLGLSKIKREFAELPDSEPTEQTTNFFTLGAGINFSYAMGRFIFSTRAEYATQRIINLGDTTLGGELERADILGGTLILLYRL